MQSWRGTPGKDLNLWQTHKRNCLRRWHGSSSSLAKPRVLAPIENRDDWDALVDSEPPEDRELLKELARFTDLWRYLREREEKLGTEIVNAISQVHRLPISERISQLKAINQKLMERIGDARQGAQFRH